MSLKKKKEREIYCAKQVYMKIENKPISHEVDVTLKKKRKKKYARVYRLRNGWE